MPEASEEKSRLEHHAHVQVRRYVPPLSFKHLRRLTDGTGLFQHAYFGVPRRLDGYCSDDNSRALILMAREQRRAPRDEVIDLATTYLSFLQYAQRADGLFRNFMLYDRSWAGLPAGEDCQGRCLWALAESLDSPMPEHIRMPVWDMFARAIEWFDKIHYLRSLCFTLLAMERICSVRDEQRFRRIAARAAERLAESFDEHADGQWQWFEDKLTYANGRLPHAMFAAHALLDEQRYLDIARRSMDFLISVTAADGIFDPVGSNGWYERHGHRAQFDQQPIEAMSTSAAAIAAFESTGSRDYLEVAAMCGRWFVGGNVLSAPVADIDRGSCRDGLHAEGPNANEGAESTLSYLLTMQALCQYDVDLTLAQESI